MKLYPFVNRFAFVNIFHQIFMNKKQAISPCYIDVTKKECAIFDITVGYFLHLGFMLLTKKTGMLLYF